MTIVELERTEHVGISRAQIECKKRGIHTGYKGGYVKERVLTVAEVWGKEKSSEECSGVAVGHVQLANGGPVPVDINIRPKERQAVWV